MSGLEGIVLDCRHASELARFREAALGWRIRPYDQAEVTRLAAKTRKNRMHVDIGLLRLGATVVSERDSHRILADPEGNEFCVSFSD